MDEIEKGNIKPGAKFVKKDLYIKYVEVTKDHDMKAVTFGRYLSKFCLVNGLEVINHHTKSCRQMEIVGKIEKLLTLTLKGDKVQDDSITDSEFLF